ncbi:MAG TPA: sugar porter family MFS transporter [Chitinophagaceae bacterium]|jgi:sugar porter (SP) family MFS transporter|nr:sugar porter family MFS transporter [Chitinophagaceae bacterium]
MQQRKVMTWSLIAGLGGFLFGFETTVVSGAEQAIQQYWDLNAWAHGFTVAVSLIGALCGALAGRVTADAWGRKKTLKVAALLFLLVSIGAALTQHWPLFLFFRFLAGAGAGISVTTGNVYISEIVPDRSRARLASLFQLTVVAGLVAAYFSNYLIAFHYGHSGAWRWMLGIQAAPALLYLGLLRGIPESPRWLFVHFKRPGDAREVLKQIHPRRYEEALSAIRDNSLREQAANRPSQLLTPKYRWAVFLSVLLAAFSQVTGIHAILCYAPRIFQMAGLEKSNALLSSVGLGLAYLLFSMLAVRVLRQVNQRKLLLAGSIGLLLALVLVSQSFSKGGSAGVLMACLVLFVACFATGQDLVSRVFCTEAFPEYLQAGGQAVVFFTHALLAAVVIILFPPLYVAFGPGSTFLIFASTLVVQLLFVWRFMPDSGKRLRAVEGKG